MFVSKGREEIDKFSSEISLLKALRENLNFLHKRHNHLKPFIVAAQSLMKPPSSTMTKATDIDRVIDAASGSQCLAAFHSFRHIGIGSMSMLQERNSTNITDDFLLPLYR